MNNEDDFIPNPQTLLGAYAALDYAQTFYEIYFRFDYTITYVL